MGASEKTKVLDLACGKGFQLSNLAFGFYLNYFFSISGTIYLILER
jgi:hypothetical protein